MPDTIISPNMGMPVPTVSECPGPAWATDNNACLSAIDSHNHSTGQGVSITPDGININADFPMNNNDIITARTLRFQSQVAAPNGAADLGCLAEVGVDLYYIDGAGNAIRITQSGSLAGAAGTITGLPSGTASAAFAGGTFTFQSATNTAAAMDFGPTTIRQGAASGYGVTISANAGQAANYAIGLPAALPASTKFVTLDVSGNLGDTYDVDNSTIQVKNAGITYPKLQATNIQIASSSSTFSTASTSFTTITAQTLNFAATSGRYVVVTFQPVAGTSFPSYITSSTGCFVALEVDGTIKATWEFAAGRHPSSLQYVFNPASGATLTYRLQAKVNSGSMEANLGVMTIREIQMIQKQAVDISFAQGIDTKTDPKRLQMGKFLQLENMIFNKAGLLDKRNGYAKLSSLPDTTYSYLTTFNDGLTAIGPNIAAYNTGNSGWVSKGAIEPLSLSTLSLIRNNLNQTTSDSVTSDNGLVCTVYLESDGSTTTAKYAIADATTGQNIVSPAVIPVASGTVTGGLRVFYLGTNFIIVFTNVITATSHLQYVAISAYNPTTVSANTDIAAVYVSATTLSWDAYVNNDTLYIAYNTTTGGQALKVTKLTAGLTLVTAVTFSTSIATMVSVTADNTTSNNPTIYVSFYDVVSFTGYTLAVDQSLNTVLAPTQIIPSGTFLNITSSAQNGVCTVFAEASNVYSGSSGLATNYIYSVTVTRAGTVGTPAIVIRSVGLASKSFIINGNIYFLSVYSSSYQPTYFLINGSDSTSAAPVIAAKLAYENGSGYKTIGLPGVTVDDNVASISYLIKDLIQAVNKDTNVATGTQVNGIYSQTGVNLSKFVFGTDGLDTSEISNDLHITGGFLSMYDGYLPVEHNFFLWPDLNQSVSTDAYTWSTTGGSMKAQPDGATNTNAYYYQYTYEWTDNQGNAFRSAPSIPLAVTTTASGTTGSVALKIPTLRLTMKVANKVKLVVYRWSVAQQVYYQTTSITSPVLNSTTADSVTFTDTNSDATILGNNILYTTGQVAEDVNAPASNILALFDTRMWLVDAENPNVLWFSKQCIQGVPVEMTDLFTIFIPPTTATRLNTGPITSLAPMDDKLIIGKKNAFLYINGTGPDNTGTNNQYSQPVFITSTVGCENQKSIVLTPQGLMFQSNKGIWLLSRSLEASYIGSEVEEFTTDATVLSAVNVPKTNRVLFTLDTGIILMYDYFYGQWGTFRGAPCVSSCIFQNMHTLINSSGDTYQERANYYLDGSNPVLWMFETGPLRLGAQQGYQRAYFFYLLGNYISPHKLQCLISYDYESNPSQSIIISPTNYSTPYGSGDEQSPYGQQSVYGGASDIESWRIFLQRQRCMAFSLKIQEIFDPSFGTEAGAGLSLSGINLVMGFKKDFRPQIAANSAG